MDFGTGCLFRSRSRWDGPLAGVPRIRTRRIRAHAGCSETHQPEAGCSHLVQKVLQRLVIGRDASDNVLILFHGLSSLRQCFKAPPQLGHCRHHHHALAFSRRGPDRQGRQHQHEPQIQEQQGDTGTQVHWVAGVPVITENGPPSTARSSRSGYDDRADRRKGWSIMASTPGSNRAAFRFSEWRELPAIENAVTPAVGGGVVLIVAALA